MPRLKQLDQNAVPTTSLADMMFLLLIFFIVTATLTHMKGFTSDMPAGAKTQAPASEKSTAIALVNDTVKVNDSDMTYEAMERFLRSLNLEQKTGNARIVVLSTSGHVSYQRYFQTMALIQSCGGVVAIETEEEKK